MLLRLGQIADYGTNHKIERKTIRHISLIKHNNTYTLKNKPKKTTNTYITERCAYPAGIAVVPYKYNFVFPRLLLVLLRRQRLPSTLRWAIVRESEERNET